MEKLYAEEWNNSEEFEKEPQFQYGFETRESAQYIKEGVDFVFNQNPELISIGTKEQYSEYIDSIYPESKMKDIVFHGTAQEFDVFERRETNYNNDEMTGQMGFYFTHSLKSAEVYREVSSKSLSDAQPTAELVRKFYHGEAGKVLPVVLNLRKSKKYKMFTDFYDDVEQNGVDSFHNEGFDSVEIESDNSGTDEVMVVNPAQIHILGSKNDMESFKKYVKENKNSD